MGYRCKSCGSIQQGTGIMFKECFDCWNKHKTNDGSIMDSEKDTYVIVINDSNYEYNIETYGIEEVEKELRKTGKGDVFNIKGLGSLEVSLISWVWLKNICCKKFYCNLKESA